MYDYSEWVVEGIINGYKRGERPFSKTVDFTNTYLLNGIITQEQANFIAAACPSPIAEENEEIQND